MPTPIAPTYDPRNPVACYRALATDLLAEAAKAAARGPIPPVIVTGTPDASLEGLVVAFFRVTTDDPLEALADILPKTEAQGYVLVALGEHTVETETDARTVATVTALIVVTGHPSVLAVQPLEPGAPLEWHEGVLAALPSVGPSETIH